MSKNIHYFDKSCISIYNRTINQWNKSGGQNNETIKFNRSKL